MKLESFLFTLLVSAFFVSHGVSAQEEEQVASKKRILVSVGDLKENDNLIWKKEVCNQIFTIANQVVGSGIDVVCKSFDTRYFRGQDLDDSYGKFDYFLRVLRSRDADLGIDVTKLKRYNQTDFKTLGWTFRDGEKTQIRKEQAMARALGNFFYYVNNERAFKAGLLVNGVSESEEVLYDQKHGVFKERITNLPISIDRAYKLFESESDRKKNYLRTGIEIGVLLSAGMASYYQNLSVNEVDFDYSLKEGLRKKLVTGEGIRFDDNDKNINFGHEFAGVLYYQTARSNGLNSLESFLATFASSTIWETMEYREVLSINDEILTPVGGYVIGEASYQLSCALIQKNNIVAKTFGYAINPALAANHGIDKLKKSDKFASAPDCSKPRFSEISTYVGLEQGQKAYRPSEEQNRIIGLDATIVTVDGYNKEGKSSKLIYDTAMAKALIEANGNQGIADLKMVAQIMAMAYNQKDISKDELGQLRGYDLLIGVGSGTTWNNRGSAYYDGHEDFYGTINVLGANASASVFYNGLHIKADLAFYGDFSMVKSYSIEKFSAANPGAVEQNPSVLSRHGYYYGLGTTAIGAIAIANGNWEVGYNGQFSNAKSIDGHHRGEELVTRRDQFRDSQTSNRIYLSYQLTKNLKLRISREVYVREGSVNNDFKTSGVETRTMGTLVYSF